MEKNDSTFDLHTPDTSTVILCLKPVPTDLEKLERQMATAGISDCMRRRVFSLLAEAKGVSGYHRIELPCGTLTVGLSHYYESPEKKAAVQEETRAKSHAKGFGQC